MCFKMFIYDIDCKLGDSAKLQHRRIKNKTACPPAPLLIFYISVWHITM